MSTIAVIGDRDTVSAFSALGAQVYATADHREAARRIAALAKEDCAVIFITEQLAQQLEQTLAGYRSKTTPAIILIPNNGGSMGLGLANIKSSVERAIGTDILK